MALKLQQILGTSIAGTFLFCFLFFFALFAEVIGDRNCYLTTLKFVAISRTLSYMAPPDELSLNFT